MYSPIGFAIKSTFDRISVAFFLTLPCVSDRDESATYSGTRCERYRRRRRKAGHSRSFDSLHEAVAAILLIPTDQRGNGKDGGVQQRHATAATTAAAATAVRHSISISSSSSSSSLHCSNRSLRHRRRKISPRELFQFSALLSPFARRTRDECSNANVQRRSDAPAASAASAAAAHCSHDHGPVSEPSSGAAKGDGNIENRSTIRKKRTSQQCRRHERLQEEEEEEVQHE